MYPLHEKRRGYQGRVVEDNTWPGAIQVGRNKIFGQATYDWAGTSSLRAVRAGDPPELLPRG